MNLDAVRQPEAKRFVGDETPLEGLKRLEGDRLALVESRTLDEWNKALLDNLRRMSDDLTNASLKIVPCSNVSLGKMMIREPEEDCRKTMLILTSIDDDIATADLTVRKKDGLIEVAIEKFQGQRRKPQMDGFKEDNDQSWSFFLVNSVKTAADESRFDRALLRDITTTEYYRVFETMPGDKPRERREHMKQLYNNVAGQCDFRKKEGNYYVREFP